MLIYSEQLLLFFYLFTSSFAAVWAVTIDKCIKQFLNITRKDIPGAPLLFFIYFQNSKKEIFHPVSFQSPLDKHVVNESVVSLFITF